MDKQKEFLDKVVRHIMERFKEEHSKDSTAYFTQQIVDMDTFVNFCDNFGLTDLELNYVYWRYKYLMGWEKEDKSSYYLDKNIVTINNSDDYYNNRI